jgi:hypothetical protein
MPRPLMFFYPPFSSCRSHLPWRRRKHALPSLRPMSVRQSRIHPRLPAATGTTASIVRINGSVGISERKAGRCVRKHGRM